MPVISVTYNEQSHTGRINWYGSFYFGYLKSYGDKIPPIQKRMGGYFHDNDVLV